MARNNWDEELFAGHVPGEKPPPIAPDDDEPEGYPFKEHTAANYPAHDMTNPHQFRTVVRNLANIHGIATPGEVQEGREWYPKLHDAVTHSMPRGTPLSHRHGAGLVSALSPQADFKTGNIPAFHEAFGMKEKQWDVIRRSAAQGGHGTEHQRSPEAEDLLRGMSLSQSSDHGLVRAHRILQGEDPDVVMPRRTAPKTNSFTSNIEDPHGSPHVTVDYRGHDLGINSMYPSQYSGRGISSADLPTSKIQFTKAGKPAKRFGVKTRYEHFEDAYRDAAGAVGEQHHTAMQAINWTVGKRLETTAPTRSGQPRVKGVARHGQPYL